ncbi:HAD family hydrolase [Marinobacter sp.]|uniref:HAD family hydrolase n=1 Tax=Marinobacter sp. TaxID=50741 RepID=UPI0038501E5D
MHKIAEYRTWVFDCDGVILNSNRVKTDAFYSAAKPWGEDAARRLVEHHVRNGGISRYAKFEYFLKEIVGRPAVDRKELEELIESYASQVRQGLAECEVAPGLTELRELTRGSRWMVVSGGDQAELRAVFQTRSLAELFDGGIFGSPDTKDEILSREVASGLIAFPALFLGDSQYDYEAASRAGLDFIFVSGWSESAYSFESADFRVNSVGDLLG